MKAFLIAVVLLIVLAFGASFLLNTEVATASSDAYTVPDTVRLDPGQSSVAVAE